MYNDYDDESDSVNTLNNSQILLSHNVHNITNIEKYEIEVPLKRTRQDHAVNCVDSGRINNTLNVFYNKDTNNGDAIGNIQKSCINNHEIEYRDTNSSNSDSNDTAIYDPTPLLKYSSIPSTSKDDTAIQNEQRLKRPFSKTISQNKMTNNIRINENNLEDIIVIDDYISQFNMDVRVPKRRSKLNPSNRENFDHSSVENVTATIDLTNIDIDNIIAQNNRIIEKIQNKRTTSKDPYEGQVIIVEPTIDIGLNDRLANKATSSAPASSRARKIQTTQKRNKTTTWQSQQYGPQTNDVVYVNNQLPDIIPGQDVKTKSNRSQMQGTTSSRYSTLIEEITNVQHYPSSENMQVESLTNFQPSTQNILVNDNPKVNCTCNQHKNEILSKTVDTSFLSSSSDYLVPKSQLCEINSLDNVNLQKKSNSMICPICIEPLAEKKASTLCGHIFCLTCIQSTFAKSAKKCPTCRKKLTGVGYHILYM